MTDDGVNVRELALEILLAVTKEGAHSHLVLAAVLDKHQYLAKRERGFVTRLCEGTLERMLELDYMISQFSNAKLNKIKPRIRCILRMGVYQLKYMDTVPASAACNEAVKLVGKRAPKSLRGFVNGVLRNISRNLDRITYPDEKEDPIAAWSVRYSIPEWILLQWSRDYGAEKTKAIAASFLQESRTAVRVNKTQVSPVRLRQTLAEKGILAEPVRLGEFPEFDSAMYLSGYDYLAAIPEFAAGQFSVQDLSSMLVTHLAAPKPGDYVIDVCAAPGGKCLHAAELMQGQGLVEARDLTDYKVGLIEENIKRCGLRNVRAVQWDARIWDKASIGKADVVLADLPCSGLGVLRKKPEIRYRMTKKQEKELAQLQREILAAACQYVKPGGTLIYSTCTIDRMENEENTRWLLASKPDLILVLERQFFPDEGELDGFYIAKLIRKKEREV